MDDFDFGKKPDSWQLCSYVSTTFRQWNEHDFLGMVWSIRMHFTTNIDGKDRGNNVAGSF